MGIHIHIVDMTTFEEVSDWDWIRCSGDREIPKILSSLPNSEVIYGDPMDFTFFQRPNDVEQFRSALHDALNYNTERWDQMCDLLAEDEKRGFYFSY